MVKGAPKWHALHVHSRDRYPSPASSTKTEQPTTIKDSARPPTNWEGVSFLRLMTDRVVSQCGHQLAGCLEKDGDGLGCRAVRTGLQCRVDPLGSGLVSATRGGVPDVLKLAVLHPGDDGAGIGPLTDVFGRLLRVQVLVSHRVNTTLYHCSLLEDTTSC